MVQKETKQLVMKEVLSAQFEHRHFIVPVVVQHPGGYSPLLGHAVLCPVAGHPGLRFSNW
eukprot:11174401-Lingulodinium_polyedra.AAC.1